MSVKFHKNNTNFQIAHFLAGSCHTSDNAYFMLVELKENRLSALTNYEVQTKRLQAKLLRAKTYLLHPQADEAGKLEAEADIYEIEKGNEEGKVNLEAAKQELEYIEKCIETIRPLCVYVGKMPDIEAHEATQETEWKLELIRRAENHLLTSGTIPADEFQTMRMHPGFKAEILPRIKEVQNMLVLPDGTPNAEGRILFEEQLTETKFLLPPSTMT